MRVEGPKSQIGVGKARKSGVAGGSFSLPSTGDAGAGSAPTGTAGGMASVHGLDAILALQSVETDDDRGRRAVQYGHDMLDQLEALRADLLAGHVSPQRLGSLLALLRAQQNVGDAKLTAVIDDIALRARVELAKLGIEH